MKMGAEVGYLQERHASQKGGKEGRTASIGVGIEAWK